MNASIYIIYIYIYRYIHTYVHTLIHTRVYIQKRVERALEHRHGSLARGCSMREGGGLGRGLYQYSINMKYKQAMGEWQSVPRFYFPPLVTKETELTL